MGSEGVLIYHVAEGGAWKGAGAARVSAHTRERINATLGAQSGDTVVMSAGALSSARALMGMVRVRVRPACTRARVRAHVCACVCVRVFARARVCDCVHA